MCLRALEDMVAVHRIPSPWLSINKLLQAELEAIRAYINNALGDGKSAGSNRLVGSSCFLRQISVARDNSASRYRTTSHRRE